jgi:hypothetical protein
MRAAQRSETNGVAQMIRYSMERASFFALAKAEMVARQQDVIQAMATRDRPALVDRLGDTFAYLRAEAGIEVMQFHQADFHILVRLQDPRRYGDDVSMDRPMVVAAVNSRRSQRGLEIGPTGYLALRGAVPVVRDQTFLGVAEIGVAVNSLLQSVKQATGAEVGVVLSNAMTSAGGGGGNDVTVRGSTNAALFSALTAAPAFRMAREAIHLEISLDGTRHAVVVEPLLDFSGRMIGAVVGVLLAYKDQPSPIKELIDWDQQRQDVQIKYEQVIDQFQPEGMMSPELQAIPDGPAAAAARREPPAPPAAAAFGGRYSGAARSALPAAVAMMAAPAQAWLTSPAAGW